VAARRRAIPRQSRAGKGITIAETIDRAAAEVFDSEDEVAANDGLDLMTARRGRRGLAQ
jgi:hypothetical protein